MDGGSPCWPQLSNAAEITIFPEDDASSPEQYCRSKVGPNGRPLWT